MDCYHIRLFGTPPNKTFVHLGSTMQFTSTLLKVVIYDRREFLRSATQIYFVIFCTKIIGKEAMVVPFKNNICSTFLRGEFR